MTLIKSNIILLKCDRPWCTYKWEGTEEEYHSAMLYDGKSLNHFPTKQCHKEYMAIQNNECPHCKATHEAKPERFRRGGVIPTYHDPYNRRIKR